MTLVYLILLNEGMDKCGSYICQAEGRCVCMASSQLQMAGDRPCTLQVVKSIVYLSIENLHKCQRALVIRKVDDGVRT